jgi:hypothetical protein
MQLKCIENGGKKATPAVLPGLHEVKINLRSDSAIRRQP